MRGCALGGALPRAPAPVADLGQILEMLADVAGVQPQLALPALETIAARGAQAWATTHRLGGQMKPAHLVDDRHVEGRRRGALLDVAAHVEAVLVRSAVHQLMD